MRITAMTDVSVPPLSRDQIFESFMRAAEQDTNQILRVSNLLGEVQSLKGKLLEAYDELVEVHSEAVSRAHVKAKLIELDLPEPGSLNIEALREKPKAAKRRASAARVRGDSASRKAAAKATSSVASGGSSEASPAPSVSEGQPA
ncbi:hypothetical protein BTO20_37585 (plasmid) [Mycobacterium dioxanotrophicus]|uniref:Uncharacterized protein n=2 Tax=Mycobacterium dioxanotrophicus TaxID=482462 RepID=A0A1Y0CGC9_9MYCO|nr:hypothetical protein BTO20_37585 [Mycobacterium dioxanotrophicus]